MYWQQHRHGLMQPGLRHPTSMKIENVAVEEGADLAEIRARAMKPSLEALGRFDEERVRNRFLETFVPAETKKITEDGKLMGFFVVRNRPDHLYLDHLYVDPQMQGRGIGAKVIVWVKELAQQTNLPIRLGALRGSKANEFYANNGFLRTHEDEFDIYYEWHGGAAT